MSTKLWKILVAVIITALSLAACQPQTLVETVVKTVVVTEEVETVVTQEVLVTQEVEKEVKTSGGAVKVMGVWGGTEFENFTAAVRPFTEETGIGMSFESTPDLNTVLLARVEAGNPPDLAILPQPGFLVDLAREGHLVPLDFIEMAQVQENYSQSWIDLGSHNDTLYGIWYKGALKSLVWYLPGKFESNGYTVPSTWEDMLALSDQMAADGNTPWCLGVESGVATGWVATDWIEDIMLRTTGPEIYDQWVNHEIPWTDDNVKRAFELFGQVARNEDYVWGGSTGVLSTFFGDSPVPLFEDPPGCFMHRQASFITSFFPEGTNLDEVSIFPVPEIDPQWGVPALGAGDVVVMLNDTPEARAFMEFLATPEAAETWAGAGGFISPNRGVDLSVYPDELTRIQAETLASADVFRFDGSDLMPAAIGAGTFWEQVVEYIAGENLDIVLQRIEDAAQDAYGQ